MAFKKALTDPGSIRNDIADGLKSPGYYYVLLIVIAVLIGSLSFACSDSTSPVETGTENIALERVFPELEFDRPVALLQMPGDSSRWFIVETQGRVKTFEAESTVTDAEIVLDISDRVISGGERGLLGMAFHPRFAETGFVYLSYTASENGQLVSRISRFYMPVEQLEIQADSETVILSLEQPYTNHNGGNIAFGPDGYLYIGFGDGGGAGDPEGNAQNTSTVLGAILRIDVDGGSPYSIPADNPFAESAGCESGGCPELFAWGLRNPWRWSFDPETGELWAGDVGQNQWEEIDIIRRNGNYGWNIREGSRCYQATDCASEDLVPPVTEYSHSEGCSVTGGYVYRGDRLSDFAGVYIYGDYCSGNIWGLRPTGDEYQTELLISSGLAISSFGQDTNGEVYVLDFNGGGIFQLVETS